MDMDYTEEDLMEQLKELRPRIPIDKYELETVCEEHGSLYDEIGELSAKAKGLARTAKNDLEFLEAETKNAVRKDPKKYGIDLPPGKKPTNDAIADAVCVQDSVVIAKSDYVRISLLADCFSVLQNSAEQRKGNIRNLVTLYVHNYYHAQDQGMRKEKKAMDDDYEQCIADQRQLEIDERAGEGE